MSILRKLKKLVADPPPEFVFEVSEGGISWTQTADPSNVRWSPLPEGTLNVNPLADNVLDPAAFQQAVRNLMPLSQKLRRAALILPDFAARIAVVEFDTFPENPDEQTALVRFRIKRSVPFDVDSAAIAFHVQNRPNSRKIDVTVAALPHEIASKYEAPFRAAGFHCGFVTISALAALALPAGPQFEGLSPSLMAKLSGRVVSLSLFEGALIRMFRCLELPAVDERELEDVLAPTFAFAEDELGARPKVLRLCGFPRLNAATLSRWSQEMDTPVVEVRSRFGSPGPANAGLHGYLESLEVG
jgi:type IV pilus assembly protein PilM